MDVSPLLPALGGPIGAVAGEVTRQRSIEKRLSSDLAWRWEGLGYWGRYEIQRDLRRGRTLDDPDMGAEVAAALLKDTRWKVAVWLLGVLAVVFLAIGVDALAHDRTWLAVVELALACVLIALMAWQPRTRRRLAEAERANRARAG
jgi:protein-S-isoprenylcysteine O-methyltransferase Ste14